MTSKISTFMTLVLVWLASSVWGATIPLAPGKSITIDCLTNYTLTKKETKKLDVQPVSATVTLSLDSAGTTLTIDLLNNSQAASESALYGFDLGLPGKFLSVNRMDAAFSLFPSGANWYGPTDLAKPTNAIGSSTFAARDMIFGNPEEFLDKQKVLTSSFLRNGQGGRIVVKLAGSTDARTRPLLLEPVAYFLANDPNNQNKRIQIASTGIQR